MELSAEPFDPRERELPCVSAGHGARAKAKMWGHILVGTLTTEGGGGAVRRLPWFRWSPQP